MLKLASLFPIFVELFIFFLFNSATNSNNNTNNSNCTKFILLHYCVNFLPGKPSTKFG